MIEQITTRKNMLRAMHRVQKNKGSSGLDKLPVDDLPELLAIDRENLIDIVLSGKYLPQPILGVELSVSDLTTKGSKFPRTLEVSAF